MALYFLTYDLKGGTSDDYKDLYEELEEFNAVRVLESTWCFNRFETSAAKLRDYFKKKLKTGDGILINECDDKWATSHAQGTPKDL